VTSFHFHGGHDPRLWNPLYDISVSEAEAGGPLLSALVIRKDTGQPGNGFFELVAERGRDITEPRVRPCPVTTTAATPG